MLIKFGYIIQQRQERERERERRSERVRNEASPAIGESRESHRVNSISPCFYFASTISLWCNLNGFFFFFFWREEFLLRWRLGSGFCVEIIFEFQSSRLKSSMFNLI